MSSLVRGQDKGKCAEYIEKLYFLQSAFAYVHVAETSGTRMTQDLRHNVEGGSSLYITYIRLSPGYKRAFRALCLLISNFPLFAFGAAAERRSGIDRRGCR
jgi:hypothetical protein